MTPTDAPGGSEYVILMALLAFAAFVVIGFFAWLEHRREREYLITIRAFLERGQAPPSDLVRAPTATRATRIRRGMTLIAVGGALVVIFAINPGIAGAWAIGLLPLAVGLARIAGAFVDDRS